MLSPPCSQGHDLTTMLSPPCSHPPALRAVLPATMLSPPCSQGHALRAMLSRPCARQSGGHGARRPGARWAVSLLRTSRTWRGCILASWTAAREVPILKIQRRKEEERGGKRRKEEERGGKRRKEEERGGKRRKEEERGGKRR